MNCNAIMFRGLLLSLILIQISCKQKDDQNVATAAKNSPTLVNIDENYQLNEALTHDEKFEVKSVIHFSAKYNSPKLSQYDWNMKQGHLYAVHELANGNVMYIVEQGDGKYNYTPFVVILDKEGNEIARQKIATDNKSKYNFYDAVVSTDKEGGFVLYVKKEISSPDKSTDDDSNEAKMQSTLAKYQIDKMIFNTRYSGYQGTTKPLAGILLRPLQEKGFSYIPTGDFSLQFLKGKVFISGSAAKPNQDEVPFIAILDSNLKLLKINSFDHYPQTKVDNISVNADGKLYVEGVENSAADGTYYSTNKRFVLDGDLKFISDKSDKKPFYSFYRGPSAPDYEEEEDSIVNDAKEESAVSESVVETKDTEKGSRAVFYSDKLENCYYSIKEKKINSAEIVFEKSKSQDSTTLWQTKFIFPNTYEVPYSNSTEGFRRSNGDFVFFLFLRDKAVENEALSIAIFVFNKQGRLVRQFQTPGYFQLTEFKMKESKGKLITGFISSDAKYVNNEWEYPSAFHSVIYPLD